MVEVRSPQFRTKNLQDEPRSTRRHGQAAKVDRHLDWINLKLTGFEAELELLWERMVYAGVSKKCCGATFELSDPRDHEAIPRQGQPWYSVLLFSIFYIRN